MIALQHDVLATPGWRPEMPEYPDLSARRAAFVDGSADRFAGTFEQARALACAALIRNSMEDFHAGCEADADARVTWPGGSCRYSEAALISPKALKTFTAAANGKIAEDLTVKVGFGCNPVVLANMDTALLYTTKWYLPEARDETVSKIAEGVLAELGPGALRRSVRTPKIAKALLSERGFIKSFFAAHIEGNPGPDEAARRGQEVHVETESGTRHWSRVSHLGDRDMMMFNIGLSDEVFAISMGMEQAARALPTRRREVAER